MLRFAYADPPYPGMAAKHYSGHVDYAGEVDHRELVARLCGEYDGWVLHTSSVALAGVLALIDAEGVDVRIMAWVKPFAAFKRNVSVAYAWEPVIVKAIRKPVVTQQVVSRDWIAVPMTLARGTVGAKPAEVCRWLFAVSGLQPEDNFTDLYPGSGAVSRAWQGWRDQLSVMVV